MRHSLIALAVAAIAAAVMTGTSPAKAASLPKLDVASGQATSAVEPVGRYRYRYRNYRPYRYVRPYYAPRPYYYGYGYRPYWRPYGYYGYGYRPYYRYWW